MQFVPTALRADMSLLEIDAASELIAHGTRSAGWWVDAETGEGLASPDIGDDPIAWLQRTVATRANIISAARSGTVRAYVFATGTRDLTIVPTGYWFHPYADNPRLSFVGGWAEWPVPPPPDHPSIFFDEGELLAWSGAQRPEVSQALESKARRGPRPKYDWSGMLAALLREADLNGLDTYRTLADLERWAADWFSITNNGQVPATSSIRDNLSAIFERFDRLRS